MYTKFRRVKYIYNKYIILMSSYAFHVDDLYALRDKKMEREYHTYNQMLERVYKRIIMVEKKNKSDMIYEIEPFIPGMPLYSKEYAINYIIHHMKLSGFQCTYMGESYIYVNWGNRKRSVRQTQKDAQREKQRKHYQIERVVEAPEYKQSRRKEPSGYERIVPSNMNNVAVNIKNPGEFMHSVQMDKPDFSIDNLRKIRNTAKQIQRYN